MLMDVPAETSEQGPDDAMEIGCSEDPSQPVTESAVGWPTNQRRLYRARWVVLPSFLNEWGAAFRFGKDSQRLLCVSL